MQRKVLVVIACSGKKLDRPAPARELYVGSLFKMALAAAERTPDAHVVILSGKHGLVEVDQVLEPYEQRIDSRGAITPPVVLRQLQQLRDRVGFDRVVALCGSAYTFVLRQVCQWDRLELERPLAHLGIGLQQQFLSRWPNVPPPVSIMRVEEIGRVLHDPATSEEQWADTMSRSIAELARFNVAQQVIYSCPSCGAEFHRREVSKHAAACADLQRDCRE